MVLIGVLLMVAWLMWPVVTIESSRICRYGERALAVGMVVYLLFLLFYGVFTGNWDFY